MLIHLEASFSVITCELTGAPADCGHERCSDRRSDPVSVLDPASRATGLERALRRTRPQRRPRPEAGSRRLTSRNKSYLLGPATCFTGQPLICPLARVSGEPVPNREAVSRSWGGRWWRNRPHCVRSAEWRPARVSAAISKILTWSLDAMSVVDAGRLFFQHWRPRLRRQGRIIITLHAGGWWNSSS